jgi:hypothetical protein
MTIEQLAEIIQSGQITVLLLFLWWFERADRKAAEKRERNVLRTIAEVTDEEE